MKALIDLTEEFNKKLNELQFDFDGFVYNPLNYASLLHNQFLNRNTNTIDNLFMGMNPGPFGMAQNGVPFGATSKVKDFLKINGSVDLVLDAHPKLPIVGLEMKREEESGKRFWSVMEEIYGNCEEFFKHSFATNYCPLAFIDKGSTAKNITPDKLSKQDQKKIELVCDEFLEKQINILKPKRIIAIGRYSEKMALKNKDKIEVLYLFHPSPANPKGFSYWKEGKAKEDIEKWVNGKV